MPLQLFAPSAPGPWQKFSVSVYDTYKTEGGAQAMKLFSTSLGGMNINASAPKDQGDEYEHFLRREFNILNRFVFALASRDACAVLPITQSIDLFPADVS